MPPLMMHAHPFAGLFFMILVWLVQLVLAFLIYRDAKEQKMLAPVWAILGILPMFGFACDLVYLVVRELKPARPREMPPAAPGNT